MFVKQGPLKIFCHIFCVKLYIEEIHFGKLLLKQSETV